jgi:hypothetical protein
MMASIFFILSSPMLRIAEPASAMHGSRLYQLACHAA